MSPWLGVTWPHAPFVTLVFMCPLLQEGRYRPRGDLVPPQLSFLSQSGFHNFPLTLRRDSKFHCSSGLINLHFFVPWACHVIQLWFVGRGTICKSAHLAVLVRLDAGVWDERFHPSGSRESPLDKTAQTRPSLQLPRDWISLSHCFFHPLLDLKSVSMHHEIPRNINPTPMWQEVPWRAGRKGHMTLFTAEPSQIHAASSPLPKAEPTLFPFPHHVPHFSLSLPGWFWPFPVLYIKILPTWIYQSAKEKPANGRFTKQKPGH